MRISEGVFRVQGPILSRYSVSVSVHCGMLWVLVLVALDR